MLNSLILSFGLSSGLLDSSAIIATDVIRSGDIITQSNAKIEGEASPADQAMFGREVRRTVYAGQTIAERNTTAPRLVKRNQIVSVRYVRGPLQISITGRALGAGSAGETVQIMNAQSRTVITGTVTQEGWVLAQ